MSSMNIGSSLDEVQYKLARLERIIPDLKERRVVVYGIGINAKRVIECMSSLNILGIMDKEYIGKYFYGKKVLSKEEIQLLEIDTIVIAAVPQSTQIVYKRILPFCLDNHIAILDMYGCDEIQMHKNVLEQKLMYFKLSEEELKKKISLNTALVIPFKNVLCSEIIYDEIGFYKKVEETLEQEGIIVPNFKRNRIAAKKRVSYGYDISLKRIYSMLSEMLGIEEQKIEKIKQIEERLFIENLVPRIKMIELLKYAIAQKKYIYIYSDISDGEKIINALLELYGINQYKTVVACPDILTGLLGRTIRALGEQYGYNKVLFLGDGVSDDLIIPQLYNMNFQLIQSSYDIFFEITELPIDREYLEDNSDRDEVVKSILESYDNPFLNQINPVSYDKIVAEKIGWNGGEGCISVELIPIRRFSTLNEIEKLNFPQMNNPIVSIIIPAYNQFEYTYSCLKSILLNTDNISYEVIVADDCSCDFTRELEKIVFGITVIHNNTNLIFIKNCNNAAKVAKGKYIVFLNNDTQVQLNWLMPLVKCIETEKNVGLVGAKLINPDGSLQEAGGIIWNNGKAWNYGRGKNPDMPDYSYIREVDYISGAAIMITKELWEDIGGFDEQYIPAYCEDSDLAYEVRKRGKRVLYQPDSVVLHFEGISNGINIEKGVKKYQKDNQCKFFEKWKQELLQSQYPEGQNILAACERKQKKKTVLFVSEQVPTYDRDAGSRTLDFYIQEFIRRGYIVKFIPDNFIREEPYTHRLEQIGVEVLYGKYYKKAVVNWIFGNHKDIDFAFLNYPNASVKYIDVFKELGIPVIYYGMDLHYLRFQREYELFRNENRAENVKICYQKEAYLIKNSDVVYYPSSIETEIVKKEFQRNDIKQLVSYIYDVNDICDVYKPRERKGIMFIGGYRHTPNVDAVLWFSYHIFPQIYNKIKIPFYIAGADMSTDISNIDVEGTEKLGMLTDKELEELYCKVKIIVVPLRYGAGVKGKVVEAMYHGIPIVTTSIGIEGIPNEGEAAKIADDEDSFAKAVVELYQSDEKLEKMSASGREIISKYYSREVAWNNISEDFV